MIWIKYIQDGLHYQENYTSSGGPCQSNWTGSAITIGGGYVWGDIYAFAAKHGRIVVGGDDSVCPPISFLKIDCNETNVTVDCR